MLHCAYGPLDTLGRRNVGHTEQHEHAHIDLVLAEQRHCAIEPRQIHSLVALRHRDWVNRLQSECDLESPRNRASEICRALTDSRGMRFNGDRLGSTEETGDTVYVGRRYSPWIEEVAGVVK